MNFLIRVRNGWVYGWKAFWGAIKPPFTFVINQSSDIIVLNKMIDERLDKYIKEKEDCAEENNILETKLRGIERERDQLIESLKKSVLNNEDVIKQRDKALRYLESYGKIFEIMRTYIEDPDERKRIDSILKDLKNYKNESK